VSTNEWCRRKDADEDRLRADGNDGRSIREGRKIATWVVDRDERSMDAKKHSAAMNAEGLNKGIGCMPMDGTCRQDRCGEFGVCHRAK